jgi:uncharacterized membrane protein
VDFNEFLDFLVPFAERLPALRAIAGFIIVFFIPGFAWTFVFFSRVSLIERVVLSLGLSIALVTLGILVLHVLFGMRITGINSLATIAVITALGIIIFLVRRYIINRRRTAGGE